MWFTYKDIENIKKLYIDGKSFEEIERVKKLIDNLE